MTQVSGERTDAAPQKAAGQMKMSKAGNGKAAEPAEQQTAKPKQETRITRVRTKAK